MRRFNRLERSLCVHWDARRSNVLLVTVDQSPGRLLDCAGHPVIETPTLDALAESCVAGFEPPPRTMCDTRGLGGQRKLHYPPPPLDLSDALVGTA
ncbi:hypothetical protein [Jiella mangrovi]|uniref:Uncharacterized protein n=1 Tax=Jiella mangrovi TaxID=2821407 RepID=A0ABS4BEM2_9HYPH|nr:hypothetical protein [Jiella mangrovi]MBP0614405.1 hypothetical protein [Jiella mangrovi]